MYKQLKNKYYLKFEKIVEFGKKYSTAIKIFFSIIFLILILNQLNISNIYQTIKGIKIYYFLLAFVFFFISFFFIVFKWNLLLDNNNVKTKKSRFITYWVSDLFSLLSIGSIGSEIYKSISFKNNKKKVLFISIVDKIYSQFFYIIILILFLSFFYINKIFNFIGINFLLISLNIFFIIFIFYLINIVSKKYLNLENFDNKNIILHNFYSFINMIFSIFVIYYLFKAVNLNLKLDYSLFILLSAIFLITILPISYQGLGLREFIFIEYGKIMGYPIEAMLLISLLFFLLTILHRLLALIPFLFYKNTHK